VRNVVIVSEIMAYFGFVTRHWLRIRIRVDVGYGSYCLRADIYY